MVVGTAYVLQGVTTANVMLSFAGLSSFFVRVHSHAEYL